MASGDRELFDRIRLEANGILSADIYAAIYEQALACEGAIVEVGTAHGAATIALALGARDGGKGGRVYTFDRMEGGTRAKYGDRAENEAITRGHFAKFAVADRIDLFVGDISETAEDALRDVPQIGLLMLDADGRLDRDMELFYDRLAPGAPIIIDDCEDVAFAYHQAGGTVAIDLKHKLAYGLTQLFISEGYLVPAKTLTETFFGYKPENAPALRSDFARKTRDVYRNLVFSTAPFHHRYRSLLRDTISQNPALHTTARRLKLFLTRRGWLPAA